MRGPNWGLINNLMRYSESVFQNNSVSVVCSVLSHLKIISLLAWGEGLNGEEKLSAINKLKRKKKQLNLANELTFGASFLNNILKVPQKSPRISVELRSLGSETAPKIDFFTINL